MCTRGYFIRVTSCSDFYRTKGFFCLTVMPSNPQNGSPVTVGAPCGHRQPPWKHLILNRGEKHKPNPHWLQWNEAKKCKPTFLRNSEKILLTNKHKLHPVKIWTDVRLCDVSHILTYYCQRQPGLLLSPKIYSWAVFNIFLKTDTFIKGSIAQIMGRALEPTTAVSSNCITLSEETIHSPLHTCTHIELKHTCSPHTMEERPKSVTLSETNYAY